MEKIIVNIQHGKLEGTIQGYKDLAQSVGIEDSIKNAYNVPEKKTLTDFECKSPKICDNRLILPNRYKATSNKCPKTSNTEISVISNPSVSSVKSSVCNYSDEFEIPLEESLKAVEEFIAREKELSSWKVGDTCLALWKGNGLYYKAIIDSISPCGQVAVIYDVYDVREEMCYKNLHKYAGKKCTIADEAKLDKSSKRFDKYARKKRRARKKGLYHHLDFVLLSKRISRQRRKRLRVVLRRTHIRNEIRSVQTT